MAIKIDGPISEAVGMINGRINELSSGDDLAQARRDGMMEAIALIMIALSAPARPAAQSAASNGHTTY